MGNSWLTSRDMGTVTMPARWPENQKLATWVVNQRVLQKKDI